MPVIRIPEEHWEKVWRALTETGPISRYSQDPVYYVSELHVKMLDKKKLPYELVSSDKDLNGTINHGKKSSSKI